MSYAIAIFGILLSGVLATLVTYYLNVTKEHLFFMRKKAEELYLAVERFDRDLGGHFLSAYPLVKGDISWNDFLDHQIKNSEKNDIGASIQVLMLIDIYFQNIRPAFDAYIEKRDALNFILAEHKKAYKQGGDGKKYFKPFHEQMNELNLQSKQFKQAVIDEGRKFAGADQLRPWKMR